MSEYKRFVSYVYEYRNGEKKNSCGFCRAEVRDSQCKLELHMKFSPFPYTPAFRVYTFAAGEHNSAEASAGISLGEAAYTRGTVYGQFHFPARKIGGKYDFQQLGGLIIQSDTGGLYATSWTDLPFDPEKILASGSTDTPANADSKTAAETGKSAGESITEPMPRTTTTVGADQQPSAETVRAASLETEGELVPEELPGSSCQSADLPEPPCQSADLPEPPCQSADLSDSSHRSESLPAPKEENTLHAMTRPPESENAQTPSGPFPGGPIPSPQEIRQGISRPASSVIFPESSPRKQADKSSAPANTAAASPNVSDSSEDAKAQEEDTEPPSGQPFSSGIRESWRRLQESYPHIQPFSDGQIHQCLRLAMTDLPRLQKDSWFIGSNPFLARGCQQYHHFLLGAFRDDNGRDGGWVLGIPGIYDEKERFLAGMFGFPNFKPARGTSIRPGQFGYWYRFLY